MSTTFTAETSLLAGRDSPSATPRPASFVPRTLRAALARDELPSWLCEASGLPVGTTVAALGSEIGRGAGEGSSRWIVRYFAKLLTNRPSKVRDLRVLDRRWPLDLDPHSLTLSKRVESRLIASGLFNDRLRLSDVTYGDLLSSPGLGGKSVLQFGVAAEAALDSFYGAFEPSRELIELVRAAADSWVQLVRREDPRFADLLSDKATLTDWVVCIESSDSSAAQETLPALAAALPEIVSRVEEIERSPLDLAMRAYIRAVTGLEGGRLDALLERLGLDGRPPRSLARSVNGSNVSPERIRQWQVRLVDRLPDFPVYMPALDHALNLLATTAPSDTEAAATSLQIRGISTVPFHPESVLVAARLCGRAVPFELESTPKGVRVVVESARFDADRITRAAAKQAGSFGAVSIAALLSAALNEESDLSEAQVRDALLNYSDAEFLDDDWFWFPGAQRNRLFALARAMLAVSSPLEVETIRAAMRRVKRNRQSDLIPPESIIGALLDANSGFVLDKHGRVRPSGHVEWSAELGESDRVLVDALRSSGTGVLDRASLFEACVARGMGKHAFDSSTKYSAVLEHPAADTWCLVGTAKMR